MADTAALLVGCPQHSSARSDRRIPRTRPREQPLDSMTELDRFLAGVERRAFRMALIATSNEADALDVVQDAMFKLAERYAKRPAEEWGPLFHRILQNRIQDWHRRQKVRRRWLLFSWGEGEEADGEDPIHKLPGTPEAEPIEQVVRHEAAGALQNALSRLPLRQQQAVMLRLWEGLSVAETAQAMACSEGSVKTHFSRAVTRLREMLGEHWP